MCGKDLKAYRERIASIDLEILRLISERTDVAIAIGSIKKELGLPVTDEGVEKIVVDRYMSASVESGISEDDLERIARLMIEIAKKKEVEQ